METDTSWYAKMIGGPMDGLHWPINGKWTGRETVVPPTNDRNKARYRLQPGYLREDGENAWIFDGWARPEEVDE